MTYKGKGGKQYNLAQAPFAQGGEGKVYTVNGNSGIVAKLYKNGQNTVEKERKLITMVDNPPDKSVMSQIAWPMDVLYDTGNRFVGFIMPKLEINEELNVMYEYGSTAKYPNIPWTNKIIIAKNLCAVLDAVHSAGHVVGDLNPKNISVDPRNGHVVFVDTDSYHIEDNGTIYRCNVGMPEYLPVEIQRKLKVGLTAAPLPTFSMETDNFALAVHIFQLLMNGTHPFACKILPSAPSSVFPQPTDNILNGVFPFMQPTPGTTIPLYAPHIDVLPQYMQDLFNRAFLTGHVDPNSRPTPEEWYNALGQMENELVNCKRYAHHEHHKSSKICPWCEVDQRFASGISGTQKTPLVQGTFKPKTNQGGTFGYSSPNPGYSTNVYGGSGKPTKTSKSSSKKKAIIICVSVLLVFLLMGGIFVGTQMKNNSGAVNHVVTLIDALPDNITNYAIYEEDIMAAYEAYQALDADLKERVSNADKILSCMEGFHAYRADLIRSTLQEINADSIKNTDVLTRLSSLFAELTTEQKALLSESEIQTVESMMVVHEVITGIKNLMSDAVGYYDTLTTIKSKYSSLSQADKELVYNYSDLDRVDEAYALQSNLVFTETESGGWSVKLKEGASSSIAGELVIPSEYKDVPIVAIEDYAFQNCRNITSVYVPETVTKIGIGAFKGCTKIQSMTLPFTGASIDASAYNAVFGYIFGYTTKSSGSSDYQPSDDFVNSQHDTVEQAVWQYTRYQSTYYSTKQSYFYYIPSSIREVIITNQSDVKIAAFNGCQYIENIVYTKTIESFGEAAFQNCKSLLRFNSEEDKTINLGGEYTKLGASAFRNCQLITNLIITDNVMTIENNAFDGCKEIESLTLTPKITFIGDYAFKDLKRIDKITVYDSTTVVGKGAFQGCNSLVTVSLPFTGRSNDATAYNAVFGYVFGYETLDSGSSDYQPTDTFVNHQYGSVETAVWQYTKYKSSYYSTERSFFYYIPSSIKYVTITNQSNIKIAAFNGCEHIESINYSKTIETLGEAAFQNCEALLKFNSNTAGVADLTGEIAEIGDCAFKNCSKISEIILVDGLAVIGDYAFQKTSITTLTVPNTVVAINRGALQFCNHLEELTIPFVGQSKDATAYNAVLGYIFGYETKDSGSSDYQPSDEFVNEQHDSVANAVWQYTKYKSKYYGTKQSFFYYIPATLKTVTVTKQISVPTAAFNGCYMLETITFENGKTSQGTAAFQNCNATIK